MKLIGEVEVFKIYKDGTSRSVIKENNMVMDGASEVIVDILEERRIKNWRQEQHENKVFGEKEVKSCGGTPAGFISNE